MRLVLAIAVVTASAASAQAAEDRYGPSWSGGPAAVATPYTGPLLSWGGKSAPAQVTAPQAAPPQRPETFPGGLYRSPPVPLAPVARVAPVTAPQGYAPAPYAPAATAPQSLYSRPAAATPVAALAPPPAPTAIQGGLYASYAPRFYSVHRPYGETPDPIPAPPPGDRTAFRPEASLAGAVALSGVGDGVQKDDAGDDDGMAGVGAMDDAEEAERAAKREAERTAARRAAASAGGGK